MKWLIRTSLALVLASCSPDLLPLKPYKLSLNNLGEDTDRCFSQVIYPDCSSSEELAASFSTGCTVTLTRYPGRTTLTNVCPNWGVNLDCLFYNLSGVCTDQRGDELCRYEAELAPLDE